MSLEVGFEAGASVWIPCSEKVWRTGVVVQTQDDKVVVESHSAAEKIENVEISKQSAKSGVAKLLLRNEVLKSRQGALASHDLARLPILNEAEVLHALEERFAGGVVYTSTGPVLLAVNPYRELPQLYSDSLLQQYVELSIEEDDTAVPHIYLISKAAFQGIRLHGLPQTVLVSGESGAGKTETTKFVMRFLALAGASCAESSMSEIESKVLDSIPLLEALGNAKTLRNHNSSRFGKYIELQFGSPLDSDGARLVGAHMRTYLLEKVRVTSQQKGERSFHIFYQILAAAARDSLRSDGVFSLNGIHLRCSADLHPEAFDYLKSSQCYKLLDGIDEAQHFDKVISVLDLLGIAKEDVSEALNAIMAVLYIGNIRFKTPANNSEGSEVDGGEANAALISTCKLLGADPKQFSAACCTKSRKAPGNNLIVSFVPVAKAIENRDALARHLYGAIFAFVVTRVNAALNSDNLALKGMRSWPFVGVLDIFGFEFFEKNSFEQLSINFTNELLQQYFNEVIFEHEASLYTREGVHYDPLDFPDNTEIVRLISKAPSGLLPMLDEECMFVQGSSQQWCEKLKTAHSTNKHFKIVKQRRENFIVQHFAGPVEYTSTDFVDTNRDVLSADLVQCMQTSQSSFIQQRFFEHDRSFGTRETTDERSGTRKVTKARQYSVSSEFQGQLQNLMERIRSTEPHFVRCIKPNTHCKPDEFNRKSVVEQLQYQGVLQAIEVSRAGFPMRLKHRQAVLDYRCLAPAQTRIQVEAQVARGKIDIASQLLFKSLGNGVVPGFLDGFWAVGKTLVFFKKDGVEAISGALLRLRNRMATVIQANWRSSRQRRLYRQCCTCVLRVQIAVRCLLAQKKIQALRQRRAIILVQSAWRGRQARCHSRHLLRAVHAIQAACHAHSCHMKFSRGLCVLRFLQCRFRHTRLRHIRERQWQTVLILQRWWRGCRGRHFAKLRLADRHRLRLACRRLLARWRARILEKIISKPVLGSGSLSFCRRASSGELCAGAVVLYERTIKKSTEIEDLRNERVRLANLLVELKRWTTQGISLRVLSTVFGSDCAGGDSDEPNSPRVCRRGCIRRSSENSEISLSSRGSRGEDVRLDADLQMWLDGRTAWKQQDISEYRDSSFPRMPCWMRDRGNCL